MSPAVVKTDYTLEITFPRTLDSVAEQVEIALYHSLFTGSFTSEEGEDLTITAFFDDAASREKLSNSLEQLEWVTLRKAERERIDWLVKYEQSLYARPVGTRFMIAPDRRLIEDSTRIAIVIPQEHAFGTGFHETTSLCLEMLEEIPFDGRFCADIGTGSGILAIGMALLGARRVVALDNDFATFGVLSMNLGRNGILPLQVAHFFGGPDAVRSGIRFDIVAMNIVPEVILPLIPLVSQQIVDGGFLIVSGVLDAVHAEIVEAAGPYGLGLERHRTEGEWWCGRFVRTG